MKHLVIDFQPNGMRLCKLRLRGRFLNYSIFSAHSPTEEKEASEKDNLYDMLEKEYEKCPKHDMKIILGDFNAIIGQEENLKLIISMNSLHKASTDNGMRLISYVASMDLAIGSTLFPHKNIYKASWKSPDGSTMNQIDHVLLDYHHKSSLQDVRSYRGANIDSNHFVIIAKLWSRINKQHITQELLVVKLMI
jgi:endonuclease/exonuclease/phosphatase family metal-dependent hydrolase